jgi:hypothetical protein
MCKKILVIKIFEKLTCVNPREHFDFAQGVREKESRFGWFSPSYWPIYKSSFQVERSLCGSNENRKKNNI